MLFYIDLASNQLYKIHLLQQCIKVSQLLHFLISGKSDRPSRRLAWLSYLDTHRHSSIRSTHLTDHVLRLIQVLELCTALNTCIDFLCGLIRPRYGCYGSFIVLTARAANLFKFVDRKISNALHIEIIRFLLDSWIICPRFYHSILENRATLNTLIILDYSRVNTVNSLWFIEHEAMAGSCTFVDLHRPCWWLPRLIGRWKILLLVSSKVVSSWSYCIL